MLNESARPGPKTGSDVTGGSVRTGSEKVVPGHKQKSNKEERPVGGGDRSDRVRKIRVAFIGMILDLESE